MGMGAITLSTSDQRKKIGDASHLEYDEYLESEEWQECRDFMIERAHHECEKCGSDDRLEIHNLTNKRLGNERISDLSVLCRRCHTSEYDA